MAITEINGDPLQIYPGPIASVGATVDNNVGTPSVDVTLSYSALGAAIALAFHNLKGNTGETGATGTSIVGVEKISTSGLVDTYAVSFSDGTSTTFTVTNGAKGDTGEAAGFGTPTASVDNAVGTPYVVVTATGPDTAKVFDFAFHNMKGEKGDTGNTGPAAGFGTPTASVDANVGTPSVVITASGPDTAKVFNFAFKNLKGIQGETGNGIQSIYLTGTEGKVDTYTILFTDGTTTDFTVTNGEVTTAQMNAALALKNDEVYLTLVNGEICCTYEESEE